jgi:hypothetical protein
MQVQRTTSSPTPAARLGELEAMVASLTAERDLLRASHERLRLELDLLRQRIFVAKAERVNPAQLELEFAEKLADFVRVSGLYESFASHVPV